MVGVASLPDAAAAPGALRVEAVVTAGDRLSFAADVVARGLKGPVQLAWAPDGRLFVAEADGRVRVVRPGEPERDEVALDVRALLERPHTGPLGLALHPEFARNHFVYVSFLAHDEPPGRASLRLVRLREVGDTLGEPATIVEAALTAAAGDDVGPRMAFGPDGLLYVALPPAIEFDHEPAASTPVASMLRLRDDGRVPDGVGRLTSVAGSPLGFTWHPTTGALWVILAREAGWAAFEPLARGRASGSGEGGRVTLRTAEDSGRRVGALLVHGADAGAGDLVQALEVGLDNGALAPVRLMAPVLAESLFVGIAGRVGDVVAANGGTLFLAASGEAAEAQGGGTAEEVIVRLVPRRR